MPLNFGKSILPTDREQTITTYSQWDLAQNRAITLFYPIQTNTGNTRTYGLTTSTSITSSVTNVRWETNNVTAYEQKFAYDFETQIDKSFTIEGDAYVNIPVRIDGDATDTGFCRVSGALLVSGATLTDLGGAQGQEHTQSASADDQYYSTLKISIPKTTIKKGDYLRFKMSHEVRTSGAGHKIWTNVGWDPRGDTTHDGPNEYSFAGAVTSATKISIPVIINL